MSPPPSVISACMPSSSSWILQDRRLNTVRVCKGHLAYVALLVALC